MITELEVIYVLAFAVMVSVLLAESYNDGAWWRGRQNT